MKKVVLPGSVGFGIAMLIYISIAGLSIAVAGPATDMFALSICGLGISIITGVVAIYVATTAQSPNKRLQARIDTGIWVGIIVAVILFGFAAIPQGAGYILQTITPVGFTLVAIMALTATVIFYLWSTDKSSTKIFLAPMVGIAVSCLVACVFVGFFRNVATLTSQSASLLISISTVVGLLASLPEPKFDHDTASNSYGGR